MRNTMRVTMIGAAAATALLCTFSLGAVAAEPSQGVAVLVQGSPAVDGQTVAQAAAGGSDGRDGSPEGGDRGAGLSAEERVDYARTGSISLDIATNDTKRPVPGGTLRVIEVAAMHDADGRDALEVVPEFAEAGLPLDGAGALAADDRDLAERLARFARNKGLTGASVAVDGAGHASYVATDLGLYLVVQDEAAQGYEAILPFLIAVPMAVDGALEYDVSATPKVESAGVPVPHIDVPPGQNTPTGAPPSDGPSMPGKPTNPGGGGNPGTPTGTAPGTPAGAKLPQTGQLWWPVQALGGVGGSLLLGGALLRRGRKA